MSEKNQKIQNLLAMAADLREKMKTCPDGRVLVMSQDARRFEQRAASLKATGVDR